MQSTTPDQYRQSTESTPCPLFKMFILLRYNKYSAQRKFHNTLLWYTMPDATGKLYWSKFAIVSRVGLGF